MLLGHQCHGLPKAVISQQQSSSCDPKDSDSQQQAARFSSRAGTQAENTNVTFWKQVLEFEAGIFLMVSGGRGNEHQPELCQCYMMSRDIGWALKENAWCRRVFLSVSAMMHINCLDS